MSSSKRSEHLFAPGSAGSTTSYLSKVFGLRYYIRAAARARITARNYGLAYGDLWLVLEPLFSIVVYFVVFSIVLKADRGVDNFLVFLAVGRLVFTNHQGAVLGASTSLANDPAILRDTTMTRAVIPLGVVAGAFYQWRQDLFVILVIALVTAEWPRLSWLAVIPLSLGLMMLNAGLGLTLAPIVDRYQDLRRALPVGFQLIFYMSGVMFPIEFFIRDFEHSNWAFAALMLNPVYGYVKCFQWAIMGYDIGHPIVALFASIAWTLLTLAVGLVVFTRNERGFSSFKLSHEV